MPGPRSHKCSTERESEGLSDINNKSTWMDDDASVVESFFSVSLRLFDGSFEYTVIPLLQPHLCDHGYLLSVNVDVRHGPWSGLDREVSQRHRFDCRRSITALFMPAILNGVGHRLRMTLGLLANLRPAPRAHGGSSSEDIDALTCRHLRHHRVVLCIRHLDYVYATATPSNRPIIWKSCQIISRPLKAGVRLQQGRRCFAASVAIDRGPRIWPVLVNQTCATIKADVVRAHYPARIPTELTCEYFEVVRGSTLKRPDAHGYVNSKLAEEALRRRRCLAPPAKFQFWFEPYLGRDTRDILFVSAADAEFADVSADHARPPDTTQRLTDTTEQFFKLGDAEERFAAYKIVLLASPSQATFEASAIFRNNSFDSQIKKVSVLRTRGAYLGELMRNETRRFRLWCSKQHRNGSVFVDEPLMARVRTAGRLADQLTAKRP
ncbi:hypothetical protein BIW11_02939 [Tropilaelaps mercedesae]|uniref:Uncharacterized protein n=1 Tax=Tropilaelaps mercedesae TaxID=418985 RepID=A0A1V9XUQ8_9ACAR|nr:hypothetical protein BIW11_02939 [Tropilaelaps mercedesae]